MTRSVELRHDSDAPEPRVLDDVRHVLLGVHGDLLMPSSLLTEVEQQSNDEIMFSVTYFMSNVCRENIISPQIRKLA